MAVRPTNRSHQPDWLSLVPAQAQEVDATTFVDATAEVWHNTEFASHMHAPMEIGILLTGERDTHYGGQVLHYGPGEAWLCAMWEPHGWVDGEQCRPVHLYFLPPALWDPVDPAPTWPRLFAAPPERRPRVRTPEGRARMLEIGWEVVREVEERRLDWPRAVRLALLRALLLLEREWQSPGPAQEQAPILATDLERIVPALNLATGNLHRRVAVREAAAACGLSSSRFHDVFHRTMGVGFRDFALRARLAAVARELLRTNQSVDDLAVAAGFTDGSHLHHLFTPLYGCTPAEYRHKGRVVPAREEENGRE